MKSPKVTILILNWNGKHLLINNLPSVQALNYPNFRILLIDNGSTDGSLDYIKSIVATDKRMELLALDQNYGYVGGNNKGIEKVIKDGTSEYVVTLNNDVKVTKEWLTALVKGFDQKDVGITTSNLLLYYPYQKVEIKALENLELESLKISGLNYYSLEFFEGFDGKGRFLEFPKQLIKGQSYYFAIPSRAVSKGKVEIKASNHDLIEVNVNGNLVKNAQEIELLTQYITQNAGTNFIESRMVFEDRHIFEFAVQRKQEYVDAACGAGMLIPVKLLKQFGMFRENYFAYWEDSEISFRYGRKGYKTLFVPDAVAYHVFWGSSGNKETHTQIFYGNRNRLWLIRRYYGFEKFFYHWLRSGAKTFLIGLQILGGQKVLDAKFKSRLKALVAALARG